jgi:hypothetical protein
VESMIFVIVAGTTVMRIETADSADLNGLKPKRRIKD